MLVLSIQAVWLMMTKHMLKKQEGNNMNVIPL